MASVSTHGNQDKDPHLPPSNKKSLLFCPKSKLHIHRGEIAKIIRECQEESFWKRALPFSLVSMLVTQGLVHQGYLASNPRFGSLPKVALAGLLGFGLGKVSYIGVCQSKFHSFEDQLRGSGFGPGHNRFVIFFIEGIVNEDNYKKSNNRSSPFVTLKFLKIHMLKKTF
ncbi:OCIA domain-containing protein 2 isoform 1-T1 [Trichechus inunguis]|uniref:OCIA domain-containing protein 2 isoform X1 n=1 Tax=Trichechus manatus latirostris TaxID=127582 RepID=A0A2Y9RNL6_TRIMA|nr:OCIA domain-containing protein 2 isoform X1 [Trichechus manatus latirostris]